MNWNNRVVNAKIRKEFNDEDYRLAGSFTADPIAEKGRKLLGKVFSYRMHSWWDVLADRFFKEVRENHFELALSTLDEIDKLTTEETERQSCVLGNCDRPEAHVMSTYIEEKGAYVSNREQRNSKYWELQYKDEKPLLIPYTPNITIYNTGNTLANERAKLNKELVEAGFPPLVAKELDDTAEKEALKQRAEQVKVLEAKRKEREANDELLAEIEKLEPKSSLRITPDEGEKLSDLSKHAHAAVSRCHRAHPNWTLSVHSYKDEKCVRVFRG